MVLAGKGTVEKVFRLSVLSLSGLGVLLFLLAIFPVKSGAMPFFARQTGRDCVYCHSVYPKLNETGLNFRANGYRIEGQELKEVKDWASIPASMEITVAGEYSDNKANGNSTTVSGIRIEDVELSAGGAMSKTGRVSALGTISVEQGNANDTNATIQKAFVQVNDLMGQEGKGLLNVRAGQWEIGLPFLSPRETVLKNKYMTETVLNAFTLNQKAVELNGSMNFEEGSKLTAQRYSLGIASQDINSANKLKAFYLTYALTVSEFMNVGILYRNGTEKNSDGTMDVSFNKYGIGVEGETGPFILSAGIFRSERSGENSQEDFLAEALYRAPVPGVSAGGRLEAVQQSGKKTAHALSLFGRYDIIMNVFTQLEYDYLSDASHLSGPNDRESRVNLFLAAAF